MPTTGRLACFFFDGSYDDFESIVGTWDTASLAGARMVHTTCAPEGWEEQKAPEGVPVPSACAFSAWGAMASPRFRTDLRVRAVLARPGA